MRAATTLSLLALLGSTIAAPAPHHRKGKVVYETVVKTVYYTPGVSQPTPAPQPEQPKPEAPKPEPEQPKPSEVVVTPTEPAKEEEPPKETEAPKEEAPSTSTGYMAVVDEWRQKLGLKALAHDDKLEANALNCVTASNGVMEHKLNPGSMGQVLAPGKPEKFEHVFVGGWLCEVPSTPGLGQEVCNTQSVGWAYNGQTGHNEILVSPQYSKIGCANFKDIWGCDLA